MQTTQSYLYYVYKLVSPYALAYCNSLIPMSVCVSNDKPINIENGEEKK